MSSLRGHATTARRWLTDEVPAWFVVPLAALLGAAVALRVFGAAYIVGTSAFWTWPVGDAAMMVTGWEYYVHDPWHFPLTHTFGTNGAEGMNILFLDSIPLVAFVGKLAHSVIGGDWQPYGLWHFSIYVLQAVVATLAARALGLRSLLGGLGVALLALSMYVLLARFYHEGLNGQFVLLWALLAYQRTSPARSVQRLAIEWTACLGCAVLVHPYLGAMAALIAGAAFARLAVSTPRQAAVVVGLTVVGLVAILFLFGYLPQRLPPDPGAFGEASMNLLSPVIPYRGTLVPTLGIPQDATGLQWDGGNFLGIGVLALSIVAILSAPRAVKRLLLANKLLVAALVLLACYAPANHWWLGKTEILHYEIPPRVKPVLDNLRATGRFFWPVAYALLLAACAIVQRRFGPAGAVVVFLAGCAQLVDSNAEASLVRTEMASPWEHQIDRGPWNAELQGLSRVDMYPSYICLLPIPNLPLSLFEKEREIEFVAASSGMRTNGGRAGRNITDCAKELVERTRAEKDVPRAGEADVFFRPVYSPETLPDVAGRRCVELDGTFVCKAVAR